MIVPPPVGAAMATVPIICPVAELDMLPLVRLIAAPLIPLMMPLLMIVDPGEGCATTIAEAAVVVSIVPLFVIVALAEGNTSIARRLPVESVAPEAISIVTPVIPAPTEMVAVAGLGAVVSQTTDWFAVGCPVPAVISIPVVVFTHRASAESGIATIESRNNPPDNNIVPDRSVFLVFPGHFDECP